MQIKETHVYARTDDSVSIKYCFDGVDGDYNANFFTYPQGVEHCYGTLITRQEQCWLIPLIGDPENPTTGRAKLIDAELPRSAIHSLCLTSSTAAAIKAYFAGHENAPETGEYYVIPIGHNHYQLANSPWCGNAAAHEILLAEQAINHAMIEPPVAGTQLFENELISEHDKQQIDWSRFNAQPFSDPHKPWKWTINMARDVFLIPLEHTGHDDTNSRPDVFALFWKNEVIRIEASVTGTGKGKFWDALRWTISEIEIQGQLQPEISEIVSAIESAFRAHGRLFDSTPVETIFTEFKIEQPQQ